MQLEAMSFSQINSSKGSVHLDFDTSSALSWVLYHLSHCKFLTRGSDDLPDQIEEQEIRNGGLSRLGRVKIAILGALSAEREGRMERSHLDCRVLADNN